MNNRKAFLSAINGVNRIVDTDDYEISITFYLSTEGDSQNFEMSFVASWGSDWRLQCRQAIQDWVKSHLGYDVDGLVLSDLSTI